MANLSDADVTISAKKVGKELVDYINETNKSPTEYAIVYDVKEEVDDNGDIEIVSSASGRWAYSNNLEGYFDESRVKQWLGVDSDYSYLREEVREEYRVRVNKQFTAYKKLIEAIKKTGGSIEINYKDNDVAMLWMGEGHATLELVDGEVVFSHGFEEEDFTLEAYAEQQGEDELWALEAVYGDEVADLYDMYVNACKKEKIEPSSPGDWYDNEYEEE